KGGQGGGVKLHALVLDISKGRPLWDQPKGKILKANVAKREVIINLGYGDGIKKEMTFNVFGPTYYGEALGPLKGTIEIKSILDAGTSVGHITSIFDLTGKEVTIFDQNKGAAQRAAENPMKEGDLLFNMFWKTKVALAGKFNLAEYNLNTSSVDTA